MESTDMQDSRHIEQHPWPQSPTDLMMGALGIFLGCTVIGCVIGLAVSSH